MTKTVFAKDLLKSFIDRIERLNAEKDSISDDTKEVYLEAAGTGFDAKIIRQVIRQRKKGAAKLQEEQAVFDLYWSALEGAPLFDHARDKIAAE